MEGPFGKVVHSQLEKKFCEDHGIYFVKDAHGHWMCPFCEADY